MTLTNAQLINIKEKIAIGELLTAEERNIVLNCINDTVDKLWPFRGLRPVVVAEPPNYLGRIDHIWAFLSIDDGGEGVCAAPLANNMLSVPMIAADMRRVESLKPMAQHVSTLFQKPVRLAKFTKREDVEIYQPAENTFQGDVT